jgi:hypothetical protein
LQLAHKLVAGALHLGICFHDAIHQVLSITAHCVSIDVLHNCGFLVAIPYVFLAHHETQIGLSRRCHAGKHFDHTRYWHSCHFPAILIQMQEIIEIDLNQGIA